MKILLVVFLLQGTIVSSSLKGQDSKDTSAWKFASFPDFFNFDIPDPNPKWDRAIDYFLDRVEDENPEFVLVAGDLVDGRWEDSPQQIEQLGNVYYPGWMRRMRRHNLVPYAAIGDHELGDNPWPPEHAKLVPHFYDAFERHMEHPRNGPDGYEDGTSTFKKKTGKFTQSFSSTLETEEE